jgi:hypothetical protein
MNVKQFAGEKMPSTHAKISYAKSLIRVAGYFGLWGYLPVGVILLILAEILGVIEEFGL